MYTHQVFEGQLDFNTSQGTHLNSAAEEDFVRFEEEIDRVNREYHHEFESYDYDHPIMRQLLSLYDLQDNGHSAKHMAKHGGSPPPPPPPVSV